MVEEKKKLSMERALNDMTKNKALGKKPPRPARYGMGSVNLNAEHYRQALLEAADVLETKILTHYPDIPYYPAKRMMNLITNLRISAGD